MFNSFAQLYRKQLLEQVVPFWLNHSIDHECGGFYTCIDQTGQIYDTDKFIWLQGRQVWMFATLYNQVQKKDQWLKVSEEGAKFLLAHGRAQNKQWYFSLTRQGKPLIQPYNIFSDCFATMAFAELYKATQKPQYKEVAVSTFQNIKSRQSNPKGLWSKQTSSRPMKNFSLPMILCNLCLILEDIVGKQQVDQMLRPLVKTILADFLDKDHNILMQNVGLNGQRVDCFEGRLVNAGHGNETVWFLLDIAERFKDQQLSRQCVDILLSTLNYAWDQQYGGLYYFLDLHGHPPMQLQWDQKLWWVHIETLIALLKAYKHTKDAKCLQWFQKVHEYTWKHFRDQKNGGEWFGYLRRDGSVLLPLKGGKWKGCFHVPRGLLQLWKISQQLAGSEN